MKKISIFLLVLVILFGSTQATARQAHAQYCGDMYCSGANSCMFCGGCSFCGTGCNAGTGLCNGVCEVTTNPAVANLGSGGTQVIAASVTSGLGARWVTRMDFGSYDNTKVTVAPPSDVTNPYQTTATSVGAGSSAVWATATLNDGNTCLSTGGTDTNVNVTSTISGKLFIDDGRGGGTAGNNIQDGTEPRYDGTLTGTTVNVWGVPIAVSNTGTYSRAGLSAGTNSVILNVPAGYVATTPPSATRSITLGPTINVDFGIQLMPAPTCTLGIAVNPATPINPGGNGTISVSGCTNQGTPPPTPYTWTDDPACIGSSGSGSSLGSQTDGASSSSIPWNAPSCSTSSGLTCHPRVTVNGPGGSKPYISTISIPATYTVTANVREVSDASPCTAGSGVAYVKSNVTFDLSGNSKGTNSGTYNYLCQVGGNYTLGIATPDGYTVVKNSEGGSGSSVAINPLNADKTVTFCIAPTDPWFQTDTGDTRFYSSLSNPVPTDKYASVGENAAAPVDAQYPGIFYSSGGTLKFGNGVSSGKAWTVPTEYSINAKTQNRNGGVSYDFYKSKARQEGVTIIPISDGVLDPNVLSANGVYEVKDVANGGTGMLTINSALAINGKRIVLLVSKEVTINALANITVTNGLLIIAAKGSITVDPTVTNLDGYYSAEKDIILSSAGNTCSNGVSDVPLTVNGTLIANSLKPFASVGPSGGTIQNKRSLCITNFTTPSLKVLSRPDFLIQMTDFYKTSYTKWQEVNP